MLVLLFTATLQASIPAPAATPSPSATPAAERKICRAEATTGSIMPARRVCHLRREWAAIDAANSRTAEDMRDRTQGAHPGN